MIALQRILVPTDFSESAAAALRYGVAFARAFHARLDLLHVVGPRDMEDILEGERVVHALTDAPEAANPMDPYDLMHDAERQRLASLLTEREQRDLQTQYVLRVSESGGPYGEIVRYAVEQDIDLIVMGSHGHSTVLHLLMGSVAEKMVGKAPCPVLTVRHPEHEFIRPDEAAPTVPQA